MRTIYFNLHKTLLVEYGVIISGRGPNYFSYVKFTWSVKLHQWVPEADD